MRITDVELKPKGSSLSVGLSFKDPRRLETYNVKSIFGLDADEIVSKYYGLSGENKLYEVSLKKRTITIRIELNPSASEAYSSLRDYLYKMISSSRSGLIDVIFKNKNSSIAILSGFVVKFEASLFTKTPEAQLTLDCIDPMLRSPSYTEIDVGSLDPADTVITEEESTAPHGVRFTVNVLDSNADFVIGDNSVWTFTVTPEGGFLTGDVLYLSSESNNRFIYLIRDNNVIQLADKVSAYSMWPRIFPGENKFMISDPENFEWESISYKRTYWGV